MMRRTLIPLCTGSTENKGFGSLWTEMNRLFDNFDQGFSLVPEARAQQTWVPSLNISEREKEIRITTELPGMDEKDIEVSLNHGVLTLKGEKKVEEEDNKENYYRMERSYGSFQRSVELPVEVQEDKVNASFKKGVLTVTLPKIEKPLPKKIQVKGE